MRRPTMIMSATILGLGLLSGAAGWAEDQESVNTRQVAAKQCNDGADAIDIDLSLCVGDISVLSDNNIHLFG